MYFFQLRYFQRQQLLYNIKKNKSHYFSNSQIFVVLGKMQKKAMTIWLTSRIEINTKIQTNKEFRLIGVGKDYICYNWKHRVKAWNKISEFFFLNVKNNIDNTDNVIYYPYILPFNPKMGGLSGGGSGKENLTTYSFGLLISSTVSASIWTEKISILYTVGCN